MPAFHSIEELLKTLSREQRLLKELFAKRKILSFRYEDGGERGDQYFVRP